MQKETRFLELIRLHQDSGLTVREFCSNEGIAPSTFFYWKKKLQDSIGNKDFIPLVVKSQDSSHAAPDHRSTNHRDYPASKLSDEHAKLELVFPNGTLLRIKDDLDLVHLRALIHLYD